MDENWFTFNDYDSRELGIFIEEMPEIVSATDKTEIIKIDGRDGFLSYSSDARDSFPLSITCRLNEDASIDNVCAYLRGIGKLVLSNNSKRFYNAIIYNQVSFSRTFRQYKTFTILFECQPYAYEIENDTFTYRKFNSPLTFILDNETNATFKPTIKVCGDGDTTLTINGNTINLTLDDYMTLDFELEDATKNGVNRNNKISGIFKPLIIGDNVITCGNEITQVDVIPNFRWR